MEVALARVVAGPSTDDAVCYSLDGDSATGTSVFWYDPDTQLSTPYITHDQLKEAFGAGGGAINLDLDALMVWDELGDSSWGTGDMIIFSIDAWSMYDGPPRTCLRGAGLSE